MPRRFQLALLAALLSPFVIAEPLIASAKAATQQSATGQSHNPQAGRGEQGLTLLVTVVDENGVPVSAARVTLAQVGAAPIIKGETDYAGRRELTGLSPGAYQLRVEKEGFYAFLLNDLQVGQTESVEVTLNHLQEFAEVVDVVYSPPAIDPTKTAASEQLSNHEILNLVYPTTRDIRKALPFIPGVLPDATGQVHIGGSSTYQVFDQLDGFNITHPVTGLLVTRVSTDAVRSIDVHNSRYSAEYGKGSGGVVSFTTGMGDDRYRFSATDFIPGVQTRRGLNIESWAPRATFSGPLRRRKAWFFEAVDGEYDLEIVEELPRGADRNHVWRLSNLAKTQINLSQANLLTAGFLVNWFHSEHAGLSPFDPLETTRELQQRAYLFTVKDQAYLASGTLLEVGVGVSQFHADETPLGNLLYVIRPTGTSGNYYRNSEGSARRLQWLANLTFPPVQWRGRHEFKVGADLDWITFRQLAQRGPISIFRHDETLSRQITFLNAPRFEKNNLQASGYAQDRWAVSERLLVELGVRLDSDEIVRDVVVAPRIASTYLLSRDPDTKLSAGIGLYYDATNLDFVTRPFSGRRFDLLFAADGQTPLGPPVETSFEVNEEALKVPRFVNWSIGVERKLPATVYLEVEFVQKRGHNGFTFVNQGSQAGQPSGLFSLSNERRDRYDAIQVTFRRALKGNRAILASYTRSAARSNAVLGFSIDNVLFSQQAGGPLPWDAPNRLLSWGWLPFVKGFEFAYSLDWRDGYPFSLVDENQQLVGPPNSQRFPAYFSLNVHIERRFRLWGFQWALRAGFNNVTGRQNPTFVNNNVDSPNFLTFGGGSGRAFTGRIRFLGRK